MPFVVAPFVALTSAGVSTGVAASMVASMVVKAAVTYTLKTALMMGVSRLATALLGPKQKQAERQASVTTLSLGEQPREAIFGRAATGGTLLWAWNYGGKKGTDREVVVIAVADHLCDALEGFWVDDQFYAFTADGPHPSFYLNGDPKLHVYWRPGTATQTFPESLAAGGGFSSEDLKGVAYVVFDYKYSASGKVFSAGRPTFRMRVRGKRCYDARKDSTVSGGSGPHRWTSPETWTWSENAHVCRYNWARGIYALDQVDAPQHLLIGRGLSAVEAPPERTFAPANLCDEDVPLKAGGTEKRYRVGGVLRADQAFIDVEEMFAAAMAGAIIQPEGTVDIAPGVAQAVVAEVTDGDLVIGEPVRWSDFQPAPDRVNSIIPSYIEPDQNWQTHAAPVRRLITDVLADGGPHEETLDLSLVTSGTQAQRCGEIRRRRARRERTRTITLAPWFSHLEEGDWIGWTSNRHDDGQRRVWQITSHVLGPGRRITLSLAEISAEDFSWTAAVDEATPGAPPPAEPTPPDPLDLDGVTVAPISVGGVPGVRLTWDTPVDEAITTIRAEVRLSGGADSTPTVTQDVQAGTLDVTAGVGGAVAMEARLVPLGAIDRDHTDGTWLAVTPPPLVAGDTGAVGGVPATDIVRNQDELAWAQLGDLLTRHDAAQQAVRDGYIGTLPATVVLARRITETAATAAQALLDEASARVAAIAEQAAAQAAALLAEAEARGAAIAAVETILQTADLSLAEQIEVLTAALESEVATLSAAIETSATVSASATEAVATDHELLAAQVRGTSTGDDLETINSGLIYQLRTALANAVTGLAEQITLLSAGAGEQFDPLKLWQFESTIEDFTGNGTPTWTAGSLRPADHGSDPYVVSPIGVGAVATTYPQVFMRLRRIGTPTWAGQVWWREAADSTWDSGRRSDLVEPAWDEDGFGLVKMMPDWSGVIDRLRLDLTTAQSGTDYILIDWLAVGRASPGASSAALLQEMTTRASQDSILAALIATLTGRVGVAEGAITDETALRITAVAGEAASRQAGFVALRGTYTGTSIASVTTGLFASARAAWVAADSALSTSLDAVSASLDAVSASLTAETNARVTQYGALVTSINAALAVANSKGLPPLRATTFPTTGLQVGLEVVRTDLGNRRYRYNGAGWDDVTDQRIVSTESAVASEIEARAEGDNANAVRIDTVFAGANAVGTFARDPSHQQWPTAAALPTNVVAAGATAPITTRVATGLLYGEKALGGACGAVATSGYQRQAAALKPAPAAAEPYVAVDYEITLVSGDFRRAGLEYRLNHSGGGYRRGLLSLFDQHPAPVIGRTYRGSKLVPLSAVGSVATAIVDHTDYLWLNNDTLLSGAANAAKSIVWHFVAWRPAWPEEVAAGVTLPALSAAVAAETAARIDADEVFAGWRTTAQASLDGHSASLVTHGSALTDINGRLSATWGFTFNVSGRVSGVKAQAAGAGGVVKSTLDFTFDVVRFWDGVANKPLMELSGGKLYLGAELVATSSVQLGALKKLASDRTIGSHTAITRGGATSPGAAPVKTLTFPVTTPGSKIIVTVDAQFETENSNDVWVWLKVGQVAPVWVKSGSWDMTNADQAWNLSAYKGSVFRRFTFEGLPVGTNTIVLACAFTGSSSSPCKLIDPSFTVEEDLRAA